MEWYVVMKTIHGRKYKYWQKTWREGKHVRTANKYIGPYDGNWMPVPRIPAGATTLPLPFPANHPTVEPHLVRKIFKDLADGETARNWEMPWTDRVGRNLVRQNSTVDNLIAGLGVKLTEEKAGAWFSPDENLINIPPKQLFKGKDEHEATYRYYHTLLHELIHWTGHESRLDRLNISFFGSTSYAREELIAEAGSLILMQKLGLELSEMDQHKDYFKSWLDSAGDREEAMAYAMKEAERAVNYILERKLI